MTKNRIKWTAGAATTAIAATALVIAAFSSVRDGGSNDTNPVRELEKIRGEEVAMLTSAPLVPAPITRDYATKVVVNLDVTEEVGTLASGVQYTYWTFGGTVPGSFIRVREGDLVELHLKSAPGAMMPHNIDLHAVTGPGGGAAATMVMPGGEVVFTFRALNAGLFVYHCAMAPVPVHIANGMYGLILVEPKEGMPKVDREFYVMQSEFYTKGAHGEPGLQPFDYQKGVDENPDYVVFNGAVGALTGDNALKAEVGETVRMFVGNAGPNLVSSFHVIGEVFDNVYQEGGTEVTQKNVQTTLVPAGGAAIVDFRTEVPGDYVIVDHSIFRAFAKGALGILKVEGKDNVAVYQSQKPTSGAAH